MPKIKYLFLFLIITANAYSQEYESLWGINQQRFISTLPSSSDYMTFRPDEKPEYRNRIISFFYSMGGEGISVNVLRVNGLPEKDYCFFNNMLYSVSEDWGNISAGRADSIIKNIESRYDRQSENSKEITTIITFVKERNKIILYKKPVDRDIVKLRIFYYSNDIFNILLKD